MKKLFPILCALALLCGGLTPPAKAAGEEWVSVRFFDEVTMRYGAEEETRQVEVRVDGTPIELDVPAVVRSVDGVDGRTLVPVRPIAEALGATVTWLAETRQVAIQREGDTVLLTLGSAIAQVNGVEARLPGAVPAQVARYGETERTMVPLRFVSEQLQAEVAWDNDTFTAMVDTGETGVLWTPPAGWDPAALSVALDAGHGGSAYGAEYEGYLEKDIALAVTLRVGELLEEKGYNVLRVRDKDVYVDLYDRCDLANAAGCDIFVSIHANAARKYPDYQGTYTYHYPGSVKGEKLAQAVQTAAVRATGAVDRGLLANDYVVLRETVMPACLIETGFMSCHEELMRLVDPAYQEKLAQGIAKGIETYLNTLPEKTA